MFVDIRQRHHRRYVRRRCIRGAEVVLLLALWLHAVAAEGQHHCVILPAIRQQGLHLIAYVLRGGQQVGIAFGGRVGLGEVNDAAVVRVA